MVAAIVLVAAGAWAGPELWLYPAEAGPREGGHVVPPGEPLTLVIENRGGGGGDATAYGVNLVVAVADPALVVTLEVGGQSLDVTGFEIGVPALPCSGRGMPPHGVYPAAFTLLPLGDLTAGATVELDVLVEGAQGVEVHFDTVATGIRETGNGPKCFDVVNPSGHDVTVREVPGGGDPSGDCPRVRISKSVQPPVADIGDPVVFLIGIENRGDCDLTDPTVFDLMPQIQLADGTVVPATTVTSTDPSASVITSDRVEWPLGGVIAAGESWLGRIEVLLDVPTADGTRLLNTACIQAAEMEAPQCASVVLSIGDIGRDQGPAGAGFWCHAVTVADRDRPWQPVDPEDLEAWLIEVDGGSMVFSELVDITEAGAARAILCRGGGSDATRRVVRQLLATWLNLISLRLDGALALAELCPGTAELPDDADATLTVAEVVERTESALIDGADRSVLGFWAEVLDFINSSLEPGEEGCQRPRTGGSRRMGG